MAACYSSELNFGLWIWPPIPVLQALCFPDSKKLTSVRGTEPGAAHRVITHRSFTGAFQLLAVSNAGGCVQRVIWQASLDFGLLGVTPAA